MFVLNSKLTNGNDINLNISSNALNYGFSLFETIKLYNFKAQLLREHIDRLNRSLCTLNIDYKLEFETVYSSIEELVCALEVKCGAIKLLVFENEGLYNTLIFYNSRIYDDELYKSGYKIMLSDHRTNQSSVFTYHKTSNYGDNIFALRGAKRKGFDEVIFENYLGMISEGSYSNVFLVKDGIVYTPSLESGILNGVMRSLIIKSLKDIAINIVETDLRYSDFIDADEVFLSNSLMNVMPVSMLDNKNYNLKNYKIYHKIKRQLHLVLGENYFG